MKFAVKNTEFKICKHIIFKKKYFFSEKQIFYRGLLTYSFSLKIKSVNTQST